MFKFSQKPHLSDFLEKTHFNFKNFVLQWSPNRSGKRSVKVTVIVASVNRGEEIGQLLGLLARQTLLPAKIILSVERDADLPPGLDPQVQVVMGPKGLTAQRNRGLAAVQGEADAVVFYDDDFLPVPTALEGIARLFAEHPDIAGATGLLRDGVKHGGMSYEAAMEVVDAYRGTTGAACTMTPVDELYGCNMAFRVTAAQDLRFDEKLPLYAWQEDVDFAGQLMRKGRVVKTDAFAGVHRGVNKGRSPGLALGFSQMVNPAYLVRKGTMRPKKAAVLMLRNLIANHVRAFNPEPFIDRLGRVRGNWLGLWHILCGKADPMAIFSLR
jgi:GT2 family glycosyltransferase